jgi:predicted RNase H-like nuclease
VLVVAAPGAPGRLVAMTHRVLGVDGCPGGWVAAHVAAGTLTWHHGSFAELLRLPADVVAVDIPVGLPEGAARRRADVEARARLGPQRSSVFFVPPRVVLEAPTQAEATLLSRAAGSVGVSVQTFHLLAKVAEVDGVLQADRSLVDRVLEVHPEVSLRRLGGRPLPPKRSAAGRSERLSVLRRWLPSLELPVSRPGRAAPDDCLDAVACAWTAQRWLRGEAEVLGGDLDATGLPMRIVV